MISMATAASGIPITDTALASGVMDEAAFQVFYSQTARRMRAYLLRSLGDPSLADDLMQEAYLRLLRSGLKTEDEGHRKAYLFRIATNLVRDHFRRRRPEYEMPPDLPGDPGLQNTVDHRSDVAVAMSGLAPRDRQMLWLAYVEGSSHQEIAKALGLKTASLKSMLSRARHRMADRLRGLGLKPIERGEA
ncbi:MAG: RNA polymerase sigma factor [Acidobacteriota bacterium]